MSTGKLRDREFFQDILQQALVAPNPADTIAPEELRALTEVARQHGAEPFSLEPICIEMVQVLLKSYFRIGGDLPELWRKMSQEVARTLFDDKVFGKRLRRLWSHLLEAAQ